MEIEKTILKEIDAFLKKHGMSDHAFSIRACHDNKIVRNLRAGNGINSKTINKIRHFIANYNGGK